MALNRTVAASLFVLAATVVFAVACGSGDETLRGTVGAAGRSRGGDRVPGRLDG